MSCPTFGSLIHFEFIYWLTDFSCLRFIHTNSWRTPAQETAGVTPVLLSSHWQIRSLLQGFGGGLSTLGSLERGCGGLALVGVLTWDFGQQSLRSLAVRAGVHFRAWGGRCQAVGWVAAAACWHFGLDPLGLHQGLERPQPCTCKRPGLLQALPVCASWQSACSSGTWVYPLKRFVSLWSGFLDAVSMPFSGLVCMVWFLDLAMSPEALRCQSVGPEEKLEFIFVYSLRKCCNKLSFTCQSFSAPALKRLSFLHCIFLLPFVID